MKRQNNATLNMDEILGGGSMKDLINKANDNPFSSLKEEKDVCMNKEEATKEETETSNKNLLKKECKRKRHSKSETSCYSFICDNSIKETIQAISRREGWTIRDIMEFALTQFIDQYSRVKPGLRISKNTNSIENVMQKKP